MKLWSLIFLLLSQSVFASVDSFSQNFAPSSNIKIDNSQISFDLQNSETSAYTITRAEFLSTLSIARKLFTPLAAEKNRRLEIFSDWNSNWTQAFARRWDTDQVLIYGGIARIPGGTQDSLALLLCHEIGHLYAGAPYSDEHNMLSAEGQADWWATNLCWFQLAKELKTSTQNLRTTSNSLSEISQPPAEELFKLKDRALKAALIVTAFYAANRNIPAPLIETPDLTIVDKTLLTHPEPQCRLDTYVAGLIGSPRPFCWWKAD